MNDAVARRRESVPQSLLERRPTRRLQRRNVRGRRAGSSQEWRPVVVEAGEVGWNFDRCGLNVCKSRTLKQRGQRRLPTQGKAPALVDDIRRGVRCRGPFPENAQELHAVCIIPNVDCHSPAGTKPIANGRQNQPRVGQKVEYQSRNGEIKSTLAVWKFISAPDDECCSRTREISASELNEWLGRIAGDDGSRVARITDGGRERAGAAPDLEPVRVRSRAQPIDEGPRKPAAPATHIRFICVAGQPSVTRRT